MIDNFVALSANERTYLAWIRTAISIVGFGLLIDKLDPAQQDGNMLMGGLLITSGALLIAFAAIRFTALNKRIKSSQSEAAFGPRFTIVFILMNSALALLLVMFVLHVS
jgi:putative membrane protein